jgi:UDP-glucose 4-epimerase
MTRAVVLGGSGFLGSYVADELSRRGFEVVIGDLIPPACPVAGQTYVPCDIMRPENVREVIGSADAVYNFAGMADLDESLHSPRETIMLNVIGNINVLDACVDAKPKRFVYASSAYALSNKGGFYGISKYSSERVIREYGSRFGLPFTIIRYGSLYGDRADRHNGIYQLLYQALTTSRIVHNGDGEETREYIHAADAARLSVDILDDQYTNENVMLTGVERMKQKDILQMIREITGDRIAIEFTNTPWDAHYRVTPYSLHPELGKKLVANPFIDLGQGLMDCIRRIRADLDGKESTFV